MTKDLPKISIVTPSFNQAEFLEATIESVLSQNYPKLEYIIIDGGSTDGSLEIIRKYEKYLHFWCSDPDEGQYDAINKGFAKSTGEIMAWINSDDMYCPWSLKTVASIFAHLPEVKWLTSLQPGNSDWQGLAIRFYSVSGYSCQAFLDGRYLPPRCQTKVAVLSSRRNSLQQESTFWRRSLWKAAGGYISTNLKLASDFELWSRFYCHAELYGILSPLGIFRIRTNQRSKQIELYCSEAENSLSTMRNLLAWSPNILKMISFYLKLNRLPKVSNLAKNLDSYTGKRIVRKNMDNREDYWTIEEYQFQ